MEREITLEVTVTVPATVGESEVERAINEALDEGEKYVEWGEWIVGAAVIKDVVKR